MSKAIVKIALVLLLFCGFSELVSSRDNGQRDNSTKSNTTSFSSGVDSLNIPAYQWPLNIGELQTGKINTIFNDFGNFGTGFGYPGQILNLSFETPSFSGNDYLFAGAIWVGAIVGNDTLVSTSADGWNVNLEEFGGENIFFPSVERAWFASDFSLRCEYMDTSTSFIDVDPMSGQPHQPLNIKITNRSHVWRTDPLDNAIYYDYLITNIGNQTLEDVYIGFYFDCDVGHSSAMDVHNDDIAGSLRDSGIAYILDNDGDPAGSAFDERSPQKAFAFELLASSFIPTDTNFNWWVSGPGINDFGPRLKPTLEDPYRDFGTGGLGTPEGDANKYYIMSHKEWDYDQIYMGSIDSTNPDWMAPEPTLGGIWAVGVDTRFLYSFGPVTIAPGETERIIFSLFTAESIHVDPFNLDNLPDYPDVYNANLNLENLLSVGSDIRQALNTILDPLAPPMGLEVYQNGFDKKVRFDPYIFGDVTGYEVYATPVDPSSFPFPGVIPPWYKPETPNHVGSSIDVIPAGSIDGLTAVNVAYNSSMGISNLSSSEFINIPILAKPITKKLSTTTSTDSVVIEWVIPDSLEEPANFKIYKYASFSDYRDDFSHPYYTEASAGEYVVDSIEVDGIWWYYNATLSPPYVTLAGDERKFVDYNFIDGYMYFIVSVDSSGFESDLAQTTSYLVPERSKDFLIITNTSLTTFSTNPETIINYYQELLNSTEFTFDIFSVRDSLKESVCSFESLDLCPNWQTMSLYRCVIIDESEYTYAPLERINELKDYLETGGKVARFGIHTLLSYNPGNILGMYQSEISEFGVDSLYYVTHMYNIPNPIEEGRFGFNTARSADYRFPSLVCDTSRYPLDPSWVRYFDHPTNEPITVSVFIPSDSAIITHRYKSLYPSTSELENMAVGVKNIWSDYFNYAEIYSFGFHLYYMSSIDSRNLLRSILDSSLIYPSYFSFTPETGSSYSVELDSVTIDGNHLSESGEVAVYDGNLCVGATIVTGDWPLTVIAWADDPLTPEIDGFTSGNKMKFVATFDGSSLHSVCPDSAGYMQGDGTFDSDASSRVGLSSEECSCCIGIRGNIDGDPFDQIDITDLVFLVAYMFSDGDEPPCMDEANIDGIAGESPIDISDLVAIVAYMFSGGDAPTECP